LDTSQNVIRVVKSRRMRRVWHATRVGEIKKAYKILIGKPEGNRSLGKPRRRWEDSIRMDPVE
jgi:hypothetical protein